MFYGLQKVLLLCPFPSKRVLHHNISGEVVKLSFDGGYSGGLEERIYLQNSGFIGIIGYILSFFGDYREYQGIMETKMETTI